MAGTSKITVETYRNLEELVIFLRRISYHKGYEQYDSLLKNLGLLVSDYIKLCDEHLKPFGEEVYTIERFYKLIPNNPDYHKLLDEFNEYSWLICDMTLELTRLLNLILERIRERIPNYQIQDGILIIDNMEREKTEYKEQEKTDAPYPGLKRFVQERPNRYYCFSKNSTLDFI